MPAMQTGGITPANIKESMSELIISTGFAHAFFVNRTLIWYGENLFGPDDDLSRAQLCQIIYNMEGQPATSGSSVFTDVADGAWYADAVTWAASQGIVGGYGNGLFGPEDNITREQLASILYRYAQSKGYDTSVGENTNILSYIDALEISELGFR